MNLFDTDELQYRYVIGIDLGTTNSAVAYVDLSQETSGASRRKIRFFQIPQVVAQNEVATRSVLPSFLYLPGEYDLPEGSTALPWDVERRYLVGEFAREQGARVSSRLVASAKSWLCHAGVDRTAPILPWGVTEGVGKVSPVDASMRYLQHIREAWDAEMVDPEDESTGFGEETNFDEQLIILTVPASFDEVARELTVQAAQEAGISKAILLEEPLAAFYAWLANHESNWQHQMADGQLILVCDIGGGTTDFSIVGIREGVNGLRFNRLAVGEHLMLGGDNMDLTLGRYVEAKLMGQPGKLNAQRWHELVHQCRKAKEILLGSSEPDAKVDITMMGAAGKLIGGTLKTQLTQSEIHQLILDGFFPETPLDAPLDQRARSGLTEFGLPYVQDPAVTRHIANFWQRYQSFLQEETGREALYPDFILFNGGTLIPTSIRNRIIDVTQSWFRPVVGEDWQPTELDNPHPELAVAIGATYYGLVRAGKGIRIGSGSPRAYYVSVDTDNEEQKQPRSKPQDVAAGSAVCLVPRGTEEGFEVRLSELNFEALTNQPVSFQIFTSSTRLGDQLGDVVQLSPEEITILPPIRTVLRYGKRGVANRLPVQLAVRLTEIGTLELWCQSQQTEHRWQLQFDVRQVAGQGAAPISAADVLAETIDQALVELVQELIQNTFTGNKTDTQYPPANLRKGVESTLAISKEQWPTAVVRKMADSLLASFGGPSLSPEHEARWLNLLGFCMRPGFGSPVDEWRIKQLWKLHQQGLQFPTQSQGRAEWWIFWRRVAGGLKSGQQMQIYEQVRTYLLPAGKRKKKPSKMFPKRLGSGEELEIWMMLANFEWLSADIKVQLGRLLLQKFRKNKPRSQALWALSRFGSRTAIYGPIDRLIPSQEAAAWIDMLLSLKLSPSNSLAHALILLARYTGDRARDIPEEKREKVARWLTQLPNPERYQELLMNPESVHQKEEQSWILGDSLPVGLVLSAD